jgi:hypothetical protein
MLNTTSQPAEAAKLSTAVQQSQASTTARSSYFASQPFSSKPAEAAASKPVVQASNNKLAQLSAEPAAQSNSSRRASAQQAQGALKTVISKIFLNIL